MICLLYLHLLTIANPRHFVPGFCAFGDDQNDVQKFQSVFQKLLHCECVSVITAWGNDQLLLTKWLEVATSILMFNVAYSILIEQQRWLNCQTSGASKMPIMKYRYTFRSAHTRSRLHYFSEIQLGWLILTEWSIFFVACFVLISKNVSCSLNYAFQIIVSKRSERWSPGSLWCE